MVAMPSYVPEAFQEKMPQVGIYVIQAGARS